MNRRAIMEATQWELDRERRGEVPLTLVNPGHFSASVKALVTQADAALYAAKRAGRDRCVIHKGAAVHVRQAPRGALRRPAP